MPYDRSNTRIRLHLIALLAALCLLGSAAAQVQLESDLTLDLTVAPGGSYDGPLVLRNIGEETVRVRLYQADYHFTAQGETLFEVPDTLPRSNGAWIQLPSSQVSIPPGEVLSLTYRIDVPEGEGIAGSYWSLIFVEGIPADEEADVNPEGFSLRQVVRYGIQVSTTIGQTGSVQLAFENPAWQQDDPDLLAFGVNVLNTGERFVRPDFQLDLYTSDGEHVGPFEVERLRIYPGTGVRPVFDLTGVTPGTYSAIFVADAGAENIFGARYSLEIPAP